MWAYMFGGCWVFCPRFQLFEVERKRSRADLEKKEQFCAVIFFLSLGSNLLNCLHFASICVHLCFGLPVYKNLQQPRLPHFLTCLPYVFWLDAGVGSISVASRPSFSLSPMQAYLARHYYGDRSVYGDETGVLFPETIVLDLRDPQIPR